MSNPSSNDNSRSASPAGLAPGGERSRAVSGSLKDRIAKFNNPDAAPLAPKHPFGTAGPAGSGSSNTAQRGLYGNRIPSLDPRFSGHLAGLGAPPGRKVSENRGMIGNRIPSTSSTGNVGALSMNSTGTNSSGRNSPASGAGVVPPPKINERPASPEGSVNSSTASNARETSSPATSRSSSPPTSPGGGGDGGLHSLVIATHPDGGPGAQTPSSTRAEAGDEGEPSAPPTPTVGSQAESLPAPQYDLVPHNLKLAAGMHRALSSMAPSIGSSAASQFDSQGNEETQMMQDVSGISTPTGTPRAANRELDGSTRGEGSVIGEGSVMGDDMEEVKKRLDSLGVQDDDGKTVPVDREATPEPVKEDVTGESEADSTATELESLDPDIENVSTEARSGDAEKAVGGTETVEARDDAVAAGHPRQQTHSKNPNKADDLDALKAGELNAEHDHDPVYGDRPMPMKSSNPINALAESGFMQNLDETKVKPGEQKEQKGMAGQRMEDIERPDEVVHPASSAGDVSAVDSESGLQVEDASEASPSPATERQEAKEEAKMRTAASDEEAAELATTSKDASAKKDGPSKSERDEAAGRTETHGAGKNVKLNETFGMREPAAQPSNLQEAREAGGEGEESGSEGETEKPPKVHGTLGGTQHTDHVGPDEPSVLERIGVGQSAEANERREQIEKGFAENGLLDYPAQEDQLREHKDKDQRDGKTLVGELNKMAEEEEVKPETEGVPQTAEDKDPDQRAHGMSIPNPFKKKDAPGGETHSPATAFIAPRAQSPGHGILDQDKDDDPIQLSGAKDLDEAESDKKPLQIQIEPAPIAQTDAAANEKALESSTETVKSPEPETTNKSGAPTPRLPSPPHTELDELDPPKSARSIGGGVSGQSTPIDPHFLKSFPLVPDEDRPRIEVHLSPHATPFVPRFPHPRSASSSAPNSPTVSTPPAVPTQSTPASKEDDVDDVPELAEALQEQHEREEAGEIGPAGEIQAEEKEETGEPAGSGLGDKVDLADVPSIPMPKLDDAIASAAAGKVPSLVPQTPPSPSKMHQPGAEQSGDNEVKDMDEMAKPKTPQVDIDAAAKHPRTDGIKESRSYSASSLDVSDKEGDGQTSKVKKRLSRKPPKSPMLDDEDPGDWTPGEDGWAVVTKGRDS